MIPIISGIIVGSKEHVSRGRAFGLSLAYVLAMAAVYALAGALAGLSGTMLSAALQTPWVLGSFALVFVLLALSMFGLYELQLPASWQTRLDAAAGRLPGGRYLGVAFMGAISALVIGPCVAAPLAGALLYIARTGDAWLGGWALFALGLGMGAPLVAVGMGARELLPRSGPWLKGVRHAFGVLMLALAWWIVRPVVPDWLWLLGWALLALATGVFLHALDPLPPQAPALRRLGKAAGLALATYGIVALIGLLSGGRNPLQPLAPRLSAAASAPAQQVPTVRSLAELEAAVRASDRPVLVDVRADWCVSCLELEHVTLDDPRVRERLAGVTRLGVDVTAADESARALLRRCELRVAGYLGPDELLPRLERWLGP
jgi:thiol:disulfide interchange protein DsbD